MSKSERDWNDDQPIYRQITDLLVSRILDGTYPEGDLLPSVRQIADEFSVSPLTAAKVFQELDKDDLTIKRRGIGSEVARGARRRLLKLEREKFLGREWPLILQRLDTLQLDVSDLLASTDAATARPQKNDIS